MREMVKRLIVVRAGPNSLHKAWHYKEGNPDFRVAVSYYGDGEYKPEGDEFVHYYKGGKWEGLFDFFTRNPQFLTEYSHIRLPDDDLGTNANDISKLFDIAEKYRLDVCQPSLTWNSFYSHFVVLNNKRFSIRYSNFVEVMAPLLTAETLRRVLPLFEGLRFGWGLDYIWTRAMDDPRERSAIVDAVAVEHLRAGKTGALYQETSKSPGGEAKRLYERAGLPEECISTLVYGGISANNVHLTRGLQLWGNLYLGWKGLRNYSGLHERKAKKSRLIINQTNNSMFGRTCLIPLPKAIDQAHGYGDVAA